MPPLAGTPPPAQGHAGRLVGTCHAHKSWPTATAHQLTAASATTGSASSERRWREGGSGGGGGGGCRACSGGSGGACEDAREAVRELHTPPARPAFTCCTPAFAATPTTAWTIARPLGGLHNQLGSLDKRRSLHSWLCCVPARCRHGAAEVGRSIQVRLPSCMCLHRAIFDQLRNVWLRQIYAQSRQIRGRQPARRIDQPAARGGMPCAALCRRAARSAIQPNSEVTGGRMGPSSICSGSQNRLGLQERGDRGRGGGARLAGRPEAGLVLPCAGLLCMPLPPSTNKPQPL